MRDGLVTVIDVRPADEFALGHLPGAINVPLADLASRLAELDPGREIVAYCRGAYCVLSFEAVAALRARGFKARRLEDGFPEWRVAGIPDLSSFGGALRKRGIVCSGAPCLFQSGSAEPAKVRLDLRAVPKVEHAAAYEVAVDVWHRLAKRAERLSGLVVRAEMAEAEASSA